MTGLILEETTTRGGTPVNPTEPPCRSIELLRVSRSKCQTCIGSRYCCLHLLFARAYNRIPQSLVCVCGRGCVL